MKDHDQVRDLIGAIRRILDGYADLLTVARDLAQRASAGPPLADVDLELHEAKFVTVETQLGDLKALLTAYGGMAPASQGVPSTHPSLAATDVKRKLRLVGVDGCKGGWLVAEADPELHDVQFCVVPNLQILFQQAALGDMLVVIDIPIGLSDNGARQVDAAARALLGSPRCNSVFTPPVRASLAAQTWGQANTLNQAACGKGLSQQAFGILPKIREVDCLITPERQAVIREAHPEVSFAVLAGRAMKHPKKTAQGQAERLAVLAGVGVSLDVAAVRQRLRHVTPDDIIDAAVCLVTAARIQQGQERVLPGVVQQDTRGLRMEIVA